MQLKGLEQQAAAGRIPTWQPPEPQPPQSLLETHGASEGTAAIPSGQCLPTTRRPARAAAAHRAAQVDSRRPAALAPAGVPSALRSLRQDPEALAQHTISCSMWRANPGYLARDGSQLASVAQQDYSWKEEEVCSAAAGRRSLPQRRWFSCAACLRCGPGRRQSVFSPRLWARGWHAISGVQPSAGPASARRRRPARPACRRTARRSSR